MKKVLIGLDIAKDKLDLALLDEDTQRFLKQTIMPNTVHGHVQLIDQARRYDNVHLVMEATGTYHLRLVEALDQAGLAFSVINPLQLKRFAQMKLRRLKTDRSDAQLLAYYGLEQNPPLSVAESALQLQLKQINTHIRQLTKQRTSLKNMRHANAQAPASAWVCDQVLVDMIGHLEGSLARLYAQQARLVAVAFAPVATLIESVKGVGPRTALAVVAYLGDLSRFQSHQQVSAYMGLNPVPFESGSSLQRRCHISKQGHAQLRTLFYLCALSAKRHNRVCRALYERLKAAGKPEKVALIAVANKLVKQVFFVVKKGQAFDNDYLEKRNLAT